jgi:hypothetical protein
MNYVFPHQNPGTRPPLWNQYCSLILGVDSSNFTSQAKSPEGLPLRLAIRTRIGGMNMTAYRSGVIVCHAAALILLFLADGCGRTGTEVNIDTEYTSIFLDNGQVFVGKLEKAGPSYVRLTDVYYIKSWVVQDKDDQNKSIRNTISLRSGEANNPAFTYINTQHILVIEPVTSNSKISELIKKARAEKNPTPE